MKITDFMLANAVMLTDPLLSGTIVMVNFVDDAELIHYYAVLNPDGTWVFGHAPYLDTCGNISNSRSLNEIEYNKFKALADEADGFDYMPVEFKFQISGDWYGGYISIMAATLQDASFQFSSMFNKCYGQVNIIAPKEYEHWIWNEDLKVFMTGEEYSNYQKQISELNRKYASRNSMYFSESLDFIVE